VKRPKPIEKNFAGDIQRMRDNFIESSSFKEVNDGGVSTSGTESVKEEKGCNSVFLARSVIRQRQPHVFLPSLRELYRQN